MTSESLAAFQHMRDNAVALRQATLRQRERITHERHQNLIDVEIGASRLRLLSEALHRGGTDTAVLFDREFLAIADEAAVSQAILRAALTDVAADSCDLQLRDRRDGILRLRAQYGCSAEFVATFDVLPVGAPTARSIALLTGSPVLVDDIAHSAVFAGEPTRAALVAAGSWAVASYPLTTGSGDVFGVLSFHHRGPRPVVGTSAMVARGASLALRGLRPIARPA